MEHRTEQEAFGATEPSQVSSDFVSTNHPHKPHKAEQISRRGFLKMLSLAALALVPKLGSVAKEYTSTSLDVTDPEEVKEIISTTAAPLGDLAVNLNRPDVAQDYFQKLSLESTGKPFNRQLMVEGLIPDPNYKIDHTKPWEDSGRILHAYLYEFTGHLYFRNKENGITDLLVEPWDSNSNEPMPW